MPKYAKFITFEGGDGSGKSTQAKLLSEVFAKEEMPHLLTREPVGEIRSFLVEGAPDRWQKESEVLLHYAARCEHIHDEIAPALAQEKWVLCDRYIDSTMAYQGYGHGVDKSFIKKLESQISGKFQPDLTFVFDIDPEIALKRADSRNNNENRYEQMGVEFQKRLREGFLQIAEKNPKRCVVIDASGEVDKIHADILKIIAKDFK